MQGLYGLLRLGNTATVYRDLSVIRSLGPLQEKSSRVIVDGQLADLSVLSSLDACKHGLIVGSFIPLTFKNPRYPVIGAWLEKNSFFVNKAELAQSVITQLVTAATKEKLVTRLSRVQRSLFRISKNHPSGFLLIVVSPFIKLLFNDYFGQHPIYYRINGDTLYFALDKWALYTDSLKTAEAVRSLDPGFCILIQDTRRFLLPVPVYPLDPPRAQQNRTVTESARTLLELLESLSTKIPSQKVCPMLFSGGIDSSIIAAVLAKSHANVRLYTLQIEEYNSDVLAAQSVADHLGLEIYVSRVTIEQLRRNVQAVANLIPNPSPLHLSIALATFQGLLTIAKDGYNWAISGGGGPDELLAGYRRHETLLNSSRLKQLQTQLRGDLLQAIPANLARDEPVSRCSGVEMFYPYLVPSIVELFVSIPLAHKISVINGHVIRKRILRRAGELLGLPLHICLRRKKALQYSTGIYKVLKKLSSAMGYSRLDRWIFSLIPESHHPLKKKLCQKYPLNNMT
ncbi:MAG: asparagine synthase C-terminal domain-containing protein [Candidatus Ranarchaeia archaeon]